MSLGAAVAVTTAVRHPLSTQAGRLERWGIGTAVSGTTDVRPIPSANQAVQLEDGTIGWHAAAKMTAW